MKNFGILAFAALLAIGCGEGPKVAPTPPAMDPAKMMEGKPTPMPGEAMPAEGTPAAAPATTPADPAATPEAKPTEGEPTPVPEKKE